MSAPNIPMITLPPESSVGQALTVPESGTTSATADESTGQEEKQPEDSTTHPPINERRGTGQEKKQPEDSTPINEGRTSQTGKQVEGPKKTGTYRMNSYQGGNQLKDLERLTKLRALIHENDLKEEVKGQIYALNKQANAAIFLGAIQAQLLDIKSDQQTRLKMATNTFFLLGILLNVIGAYVALTAASFLQTELNKVQVELNVWEKEKSPHIDVLSIFAKRFIDWDCPDPKEQLSGEYSHIPFEQRCQSIRRFQHAGRLAYVTISLGFFTCPVALGCLAFDGGPLVMKIVAPAVVGCLVLLAGACSIIYRGNTDSMWPALL